MFSESVKAFSGVIGRFENAGGKIESVERGWWIFKKTYWTFVINGQTFGPVWLDALIDPTLNLHVSRWIENRLQEVQR